MYIGRNATVVNIRFILDSKSTHVGLTPEFWISDDADDAKNYEDDSNIANKEDDNDDESKKEEDDATLEQITQTPILHQLP